MKRVIILYLMVFCASISNAQIKTQHEYDFIDNEVNNAGLRIVGNDVLTGWKDEKIRKYGCIDKDGNEIIPLQYVKINLSKDWNYIVIQTKWDNGKGLLSEDGKHTIISPNYEDILISSQTYKKFKCTIVQSTKMHFGIINNQGIVEVPPIYESLNWIDEVTK